MKGQRDQGLWPIETGVRRDLVITRQVLRGAGRYVVHDPITFRNHVFDALEYRILTCIVPSHTLADAFAYLVVLLLPLLHDRAESAARRRLSGSGP